MDRQQDIFPEVAAAVFTYLRLRAGWAIDVVSGPQFVDFRIHNVRHLYRRTIRVPHEAMVSAGEDPSAVVALLAEQLVAERVRVAGDERMETPIVVRVGK